MIGDVEGLTSFFVENVGDTGLGGSDAVDDVLESGSDVEDVVEELSVVVVRFDDAVK